METNTNAEREHFFSSVFYPLHMRPSKVFIIVFSVGQEKVIRLTRKRGEKNEKKTCQVFEFMVSITLKRAHWGGLLVTIHHKALKSLSTVMTVKHLFHLDPLNLTFTFRKTFNQFHIEHPK